MLIAIEKIWVDGLICTEEITFIKHNLVSENTSYGELLLLLGLSQKPFFVYLGLFNEFTWKSPQRVVPSGRGTVNRATSVVLLFSFSVSLYVSVSFLSLTNGKQVHRTSVLLSGHWTDSKTSVLGAFIFAIFILGNIFYRFYSSFYLGENLLRDSHGICKIISSFYLFGNNFRVWKNYFFLLIIRK